MMTVRIEPTKALLLNELPISEDTKARAAKSPRGMTGMVDQSIIGIAMLLLALSAQMWSPQYQIRLQLTCGVKPDTAERAHAMHGDCGAAKAKHGNFAREWSRVAPGGGSAVRRGRAWSAPGTELSCLKQAFGRASEIEPRRLPRPLAAMAQAAAVACAGNSA